MLENLKSFYFAIINHHELAVVLSFSTIFLIVLLLSYVIGVILNKYMVKSIKNYLGRLDSNLGQILIHNNIFKKLSYIAPGIFVYLGITLAAYPEYLWTLNIISGVQLIAHLYITITIILFLMALVNATFEYFQTLPYFKNHSLKSYAQILKIILSIVAIILVISLLLDKSPIAFLTGLGALSAVLMLVFKDTILGFVTNIQVAALDLVRVGDWITVSSLNVDGDVMEVSINTVKIRNFDKTISTIPTYSLISNSVQNWRGMTETGGRRIKRSINIDIDTIKFCNDDLTSKLADETHLKDFIISRANEKLTNITLLRVYIENYLRNHPKIHMDLTFLVRELQPTETGLPVELYIFTNDTNWVNYEGIQAEIFDYIFASLPIFELKAFQAISGRVCSTS